jgi:hypothetical protein
MGRVPGGGCHAGTSFIPERDYAGVFKKNLLFVIKISKIIAVSRVIY